jgi:hypothetical protein
VKRGNISHLTLQSTLLRRRKDVDWLRDVRGEQCDAELSKRFDRILPAVIALQRVVDEARTLGSASNIERGTTHGCRRPSPSSSAIETPSACRQFGKPMSECCNVPWARVWRSLTRLQRSSRFLGRGSPRLPLNRFAEARTRGRRRLYLTRTGFPSVYGAVCRGRSVWQLPCQMHGLPDAMPS